MDLDKYKKNSKIFWIKSRFLLLIFISSSCAFFNASKKASEPVDFPSFNHNYSLTDKAGSFRVVREAGYVKKNNRFIVKQRLFPSEGNQVIYEQSVLISNPGIYKKKHKLLRPEKSQYKVWFDKQPYVSDMEIDKDSRTLKVLLRSPETKWQGERRYPFPKSSGAFCFFSHLIECADISGFIKKSMKKKAGKMGLTIVWEGFPYQGDQYRGAPSNTPFSEATLAYDGIPNGKSVRFRLQFNGQVVFYLVDSKRQLDKIFWVSEGLSVSRF